MAPAGVDAYFRGVVWRTPIYDLRPNLRGMYPNGHRQVSPGSGGNAVPIWGWSGHRLYVQITGLQQTPPAGQFLPGRSLKLLATEFAHVSDSGQLQQVLPQADITSQVNPDTNSAVLVFRPVGEALPMRFWQLSLQFIVTDQTTPAQQPAALTLDAGYY